MQEISGLNSDQTMALTELYELGLRGDHLRAYQGTFVMPHKDALVYLMARPHDILNVSRNPMNAEEAMQEISGLNSDQTMALTELYELGLRGDHLRAYQGTFVMPHKDALVYLMARPHDILNVSHNPMNAEEAMQEISGLNSDQTMALTELYELGLRGDHLRAYQGTFVMPHKDALVNLMARPHDILNVSRNPMNAEEAMQEISGLNIDQLKGLVQYKLPNAALIRALQDKATIEPRAAEYQEMRKRCRLSSMTFALCVQHHGKAIGPRHPEEETNKSAAGKLYGIKEVVEMIAQCNQP